MLTMSHDFVVWQLAQFGPKLPSWTSLWHELHVGIASEKTRLLWQSTQSSALCWPVSLKEVSVLWLNAILLGAIFHDVGTWQDAQSIFNRFPCGDDCASALDAASVNTKMNDRLRI
jgi:hypothetical protein